MVFTTLFFFFFIKFKQLLSGLKTESLDRKKKLYELNEILLGRERARAVTPSKNLMESTTSMRGLKIAHFRSQSLEYFPSKGIYNADELMDRLQKVKDKFKEYDDEVVNEEEKTETYKSKIDELVFSIVRNF